MSPQLQYETARARQQEIVDRAINSHRSDARCTTVGRYRSVKHRLIQVVAALGVCVAAASAVAVSGAKTSQPSMSQHSGHISAQQQIRAFEAKGYVPTSCTVSGTLMRNYHTGQSVTVKLS